MVNKKDISLKIKSLNIKSKRNAKLSIGLLLVSGILTIISLNTAMPYYVLKIIVPIITTVSLVPLGLYVKQNFDRLDYEKKLDYIKSKENNNVDNDNVTNKEKEISDKYKFIDNAKSNDNKYVDLDEIIEKYSKTSNKK